MNTMDLVAVMIVAVVVPMLTAAAFLLGRHLHRRPARGEELSAVTRQHIDLFQGGQLSQALLDATKARFRDLLERGELAAVEASLRPGVQYVVQVRALAELGTDEAGRILERQLQRRLTDDQMEQSWYWIDLASSLRALNRVQSLPHLLRCAEAAGDIPLGHFFAAETVCFLGFAGYLRQPETPLGRAALRVLHRALEGLRYGVQPFMVTEARLGEAIERLWDHRPEAVHPLMARVAVETLRLLRRAPHARALVPEEVADREAFDLQMSRLTVLEPVLSDYLQEAVPALRPGLARARGQELRDVLQALNDLRAEAGGEVMELLARPGCAQAELAVELLTWSREPRVGPWLRAWVGRLVSPVRRAQWRRKPRAPRRPSVPLDVPYRAALRALRGHPSAETERFLLQAAGDWDPTYRAAALSSLGWWEPLRPAETLAALQQARRDPSPEVRQAARAALARLGERQALQWFRQALTGEEPQRVHEAIQVVSGEGLTLLWPDLDRLADAEDQDVAQHACEALERMSEEMEKRRG
jgi:hypothetical protein